jgi:hypothetical protein
MPIYETRNTITVGRICLSCVLFATKECPYGNHNRVAITTFTGDIRGKCIFYDPIMEAAAEENITMEKRAETMIDSELNIGLFRKIMSLSSADRKKLFIYWDYIYPEKYANEMVTDQNESVQRGTGKKGIRPEDLRPKDKKKLKPKDKENINKFPEPFKV